MTKAYWELELSQILIWDRIDWIYQIQVNFGRSHFHNCNICLVNIKDKLKLPYIQITNDNEITNEQMGKNAAAYILLD